MFTTRDYTAVQGAAALWDSVVRDSPDGWMFHTSTVKDFNVCAGQPFDAKDLSFFVYDGERAVGVVPLTVEKRGDTLQASYYSGYLPWPVFCGEPAQREAFEDFAFIELEKRAKAAGATRIIEYLIAARDRGDEEARINRVANKFGYSPVSFDMHQAVLDENAHARIRDRYVRYIRKFSPLFDVKVIDGAAMTAELAEAYRALHTKDAGRVVRSPETYQKQTDTVRTGEAFALVAFDKATGAPAGMLLVSLSKGIGMDGSIGIDPEFAPMRLGHILRMYALEELIRRGADVYELPLKVREGQPSTEKEQGISHFKEGWTGGAGRTIWGVEKLL